MSDVLTKLIDEGRAEIESKAEARGKAEGKIEGYIKAAISFGASDDNIISNIIKEFSLTNDSAAEYVKKARLSV